MKKYRLKKRNKFVIVYEIGVKVAAVYIFRITKKLHYYSNRLFSLKSVG